jgi:hypothetical protein
MLTVICYIWLGEVTEDYIEDQLGYNYISNVDLTSLETTFTPPKWEEVAVWNENCGKDGGLAENQILAKILQGSL